MFWAIICSQKLRYYIRYFFQCVPFLVVHIISLLRSLCASSGLARRLFRWVVSCTPRLTSIVTERLCASGSCSVRSWGGQLNPKLNGHSLVERERCVLYATVSEIMWRSYSRSCSATQCYSRAFSVAVYWYSWPLYREYYLVAVNSFTPKVDTCPLKIMWSDQGLIIEDHPCWSSKICHSVVGKPLGISRRVGISCGFRII